MIKREPPKMWRGQIVKKGRWVVRVPTLRFRDWFFCGRKRHPVVDRYPFLWITRGENEPRKMQQNLRYKQTEPVLLLHCCPPLQSLVLRWCCPMLRRTQDASFTPGAAVA